MSGGAYRLMPWAALLLMGCASNQLRLSVKSPPGTNDGRPMYMLVRRMEDPKQYASEAYSEVAAKVGSPDAAVLQTAVIYPGTIQRFQVKVPKESAVAVSFLFTAPDGNWQTLITPPLASSVEIELTVSRILRDSASSAPPAEGAGPPGAPAAPEAPKPPELPKLPGS